MSKLAPIFGFLDPGETARIVSTAVAPPVEIDDDAREEYWNEIRRQPERSGETRT